MLAPKVHDVTRIRFLLSVVVAATLFTAACATSRPRKQREDPLVRMASFDLDCPKEQLVFQRLGRGAFGVSGCGQRAKYVLLCRQVGSGIFEESDCQWVQN